MDSQIIEFIYQENLFSKGDSLLLALSGGKDSMALLHFLKSNGYNFSVAHCNFKLREAESDEDARVIQNYCKSESISCYIEDFNTSSYASNEKISIQEAARELRYAFLESLRVKIGAKFILTAHHLDDNIETMFFNLTNGTGMKGVRGMLPKNGNIVRPMLATSSDDVKDYILKHELSYREDSSNASLKYTRNKIRKAILPVLEEINPQLSKVMQKHFQRWREMDAFYTDMLDKARSEFFEYRNDAVYISIGKINKLTYRKSLLFGLLEQYGFNNADIEDVFKSIDLGIEQKEFLTSEYKLIKDRKFLILQNLENVHSNRVYLISNSTKQLKFGDKQLLEIKKKPIEKVSKLNKGKHTCYLDLSKVQFPLVLRKWERGDYFYPFGLYKSNGKRTKKNIGKSLRDLKLDAGAKDNMWVLTSDSKVLWLVGERIDDRFKVTSSTKDVLQIKLK